MRPGLRKHPSTLVILTLFTGAQQAGDWVRGLLGRPHATLTPMTRAHVWRIDEHPS